MKTFEREIKFRGKCLRKGEWWEGYYIYSGYDDKHYISSNAIIHGNLNQFVGLAHFAEVDPETVGQLTGLKDKNGKEGYQDDIIKDQGGNLGVIIWNQDDCSFAVKWLDADLIESLYEDDIKYFEIIGNIHQNKV